MSYGLQTSKLVICPRRVKNYDTETKGLHYLRLTLIGLRRSVVNPTIDQLADRAVFIFSDISMSLARFVFWTISHIFKYLGDYSPCVGNFFGVDFLTQTSVQRQR